MDISTTLINATVLNFIFSFALLIYYINKKNLKGLPELITAYLSIGFGYLILTFNNYFPGFITIIVANMFIMFGVINVLHGIIKFKKTEKINYIFDYSMFGLFIFLLLIYTYLSKSINTRIIIFSIFQIFYFIEIIFHLNKNNNEKIKNESFAISIYFIIAVFVSVVTIILTIIGANIHNLVNSSLINAITVSIISIMPFIVTLGIFLITSTLYQEELLTKSMTDSLTGLYNREAIINLAKIEISKQKRTSENMGIIIGDIDFFKHINDQHGYDTGDKILISISNLIRENLRGYDLVARYGGEEFLILIPDINLLDLYKLVEKIRTKIENNNFEIDEKTVYITMSFGITIFNNDEDELLNGIKRADTALDNAKQTGRNKISFI